MLFCCCQWFNFFIVFSVFIDVLTCLLSLLLSLNRLNPKPQKWNVKTHMKDISMNHDRVEFLREKLDNLPVSGKATWDETTSASGSFVFEFEDNLVIVVSLDYYGLNSPGLTCYLNSVLQVLFMTEDFREAVKQFVTSALFISLALYSILK